MTIKVLVNGAFGKMGQATVNAIENADDMELVAMTGRHDSLDLALLETQPDIAIDFSNAHAVVENTKMIIEENVRPVIGTSGLSISDINFFTEICQEQKLGGIIAPNFSIGAVLMMHFSKLAARHLRHVEIVEAHHEQKLDAPSGTAVKTAQLIAKEQDIEYIETEKPLFENARGANYNNIAIHSVRLPGKLAHQQVIFGSTGETLTIQHDSINRDCFMPGVLLACREAMKLDRLIYGLENLIMPEPAMKEVSLLSEEEDAD